MKAITLAIPLLALTLSACGLTVAERSAIRDSVSETVLLAIEEVRSVGYNPVDASPEAIETAQLACRLLDIGSPLLTTGINILVERRNAEAAETDQVEPVTLAEFRGAVEDGCAIVNAVLEPGETAPDEAPVPEPAPEVEPEPA